jgi:hypothetical protein
VIAVVLRRRLVFGPPMLSDVSKLFKGYESLSRLFEMVNEYIPEEKEKMLGINPTAAAQHFANIFSKKYFPLDYTGVYNGYYRVEERNEYALNRLTAHIPWDWRGQARSDYDSNWRSVAPGELIAKVISVSPWPGDGRLAVLDGFKNTVKDEHKAESILKRLPAKGYRLKEIEVLLDGSPFTGLLERCRWVHGRTGNVWLDRREDTDDRSWSRANVDRLTRDWPLCQEIEKKMQSFDSWAGHDLSARCAEVVDYMRKGAIGDKAKR